MPRYTCKSCPTSATFILNDRRRAWDRYFDTSIFICGLVFTQGFQFNVNHRDKSRRIGENEAREKGMTRYTRQLPIKIFNDRANFKELFNILCICTWIRVRLLTISLSICLLTSELYRYIMISVRILDRGQSRELFSRGRHSRLRSDCFHRKF